MILKTLSVIKKNHSVLSANEAWTRHPLSLSHISFHASSPCIRVICTIHFSLRRYRMIISVDIFDQQFLQKSQTRINIICAIPNKHWSKWSTLMGYCVSFLTSYHFIRIIWQFSSFVPSFLCFSKLFILHKNSFASHINSCHITHHCTKIIAKIVITR